MVGRCAPTAGGGGAGAPTGGAESPTAVRGKKPPGQPKQKTHGEDKARAEARTGQPSIQYIKLIKASQQSCNKGIRNFSAYHGSEIKLNGYEPDPNFFCMSVH